MSKRLAIVVSKSTQDGAYSPFVLASTAAAMGFECKLFFTFQGLNLLLPSPDLDIGLPAGSDAQIPDWRELREICRQSGVEFVVCQMSMDMLGLAPEALIEGVDFAGAATWLEFAAEADISLYI